MNNNKKESKIPVLKNNKPSLSLNITNKDKNNIDCLKDNTEEIKDLSKQIEVLKEWVLEHPDWMKSDSETITYMELVKQCMGGANDVQIKQNKENIKKIIAEKIPITDVI